MKEHNVVSFAAVVVFAVLFLLTSPAFSQTKLSYSILFPPTHRHAALASDWAKEIQKRTNGKVIINMFPGGTLTTPDKAYDGVVKGISDVALIVAGYTRGRFPLSEVIDLPLGYKNGVVATKLNNAFYNKFKPQEFHEVKVMYLHGQGPGIFHTKSPVKRLEDLQGMKIRCHGLGAKIASALGATPVPMTMGETYDALSRGVVSGALAAYEALEGFKWGEVVKFTTENLGSAYSGCFLVVMNKDKWNAFPADIQRIIEQVNEEWKDKTGKLWDEIDDSGKRFAQKLGNQTIHLTNEEDARWAKAVVPIFDDYVKNMKDKGLPGKEALEYCLDFLKANE